jgi:hypothetical protein
LLKEEMLMRAMSELVIIQDARCANQMLNPCHNYNKRQKEDDELTRDFVVRTSRNNIRAASRDAQSRSKEG